MSTSLRTEVYALERAQDLFAGGGETGALMRQQDWSQTPLGPVEIWPQSLKTSVSICLASRFPIVLYWGPEYVVLYNDAYSQILGSKHPWALGQTCRVCWAEIWDTIGPMLDSVLATGEATWSDDLLLMLRRFGYPEECYFSFSFSPIRAESGSMGGVFTAVIETTEKVVGQRRLATLRDLASRAVAAKSEQDAWQIAAETLAENPSDVPFALLCKSSEAGLQPAAAAGIELDHPLCAELCQPGTELFAQAARAMESGELVEIDLAAASAFAAALPSGAWIAAPYAAMLCPIAAMGQQSTGLLVAAVSPAKRVDESYRTFYQLLSRQIATSISEARSHVRVAKLQREAAEREAQLRQQAERERERLQELLSQAPVAIGLLTGLEHRWSFLNDFYVRMTGRSDASEFVGKTLVESLPELAGQGFVELLDRVYQGGEPFVGREMQVSLNRAPGGRPEDAYFDFIYQPMRDASGSVEAILVLAIDVTYQVRARQALQQSEERLREREAEFRGLADAMPQLVWIARPDGEVYWFNRRWCEYTGTSVEHHSGQRWQGVHDPDYLPHVLERWQASLRSGEPFEMTFPLRGADGQFRPFLTRAVPVRDSAGNILRWFGTNTDIGVEVKIREELERSQERLETALFASQRLAAIVESSDDAIISEDLTGIVSSWNPGAEKIFGYSEDEMIGRSISVIIPPDLHEDESQFLGAIARGERIEHYETHRRTKDGRLLEVALTLSPIRDEAGTITGAAKIARDITQRKQTERALHTSDRLASVGRLAATIAHEINNPLEAVTNLVYLARCNSQEGPTREFLDHAEQELVRVSMLTKQTLGFYRETRGVVSESLGRLLPPLVTVFASRAINKQISIDTQIRQDPQIQCIPGEIRQLFVNLLNNSIDAVSHNGRIRVRVSAGREWNGKGRPGVRLTVADSGPGIPDSVRRQIFEPFFTTKKDVGTGLGLWVCKGIVSKHGGELRVRSRTTPGSSFTAFSVFLPAQVDLPKEVDSVSFPQRPAEVVGLRIA